MPRIHRLIHLVLLACMLAFALPASAEDEGGSKILVARPDFQDQLYGSTILLVKDMPDGSALGFILNKPTDITLGELFPGDGPSLKVPDPVFLGGPFGIDMVFALVKRHDSPGKGALQVAPDLFLAIEADTVDSIIKSEADHARFLVGMVVWRPGELREEMERGLWYEMKTDPRLVVDKHTEGLWQKLVDSSEMARHSI